MKKLPAIFLLISLLPSIVLADFSRSQVTLHPSFPGSGPFIIEISGIWPTDCHPGEQKPVVKSLDGHTVIVEFEIIVIHVTCNTTDVDYRVLVDMSETIRGTKPLGDTLELQVTFDGEMLKEPLQLICPQESDCENLAADQQLAEPGLYYAPYLASQGLLVARQNAATAIYPLVYDSSGSSEWLFTGNVMVENTFFTEIQSFSGGDCFGCEPTGTKPEMTTVGYLSVLVDQPDSLLVKINDGPFTAYESLVYGYRTFQVGAAGEQTVIDLEGRWGISENRGTNPPLGDLTEFFPGAFDLELDAYNPADNAIPTVGQVSYLVITPVGDILGQLVCRGQIAIDGMTDVCEFIDPTDAAEPLFLFYQQGPTTLGIEYGRPVPAVGTPPGGRAARLD